MLLDPGTRLGPLCVQEQQSRLATTLDQLIGLGDQLVGQQPRVLNLQLIQGGTDRLFEENLISQERGIDRDMGQTGRGLDEFGRRSFR